MKNKDKIIIKICRSVIVVFGVLTVFNVIMLINKKSYALFQRTVETNNVIHIQTASEFPSDNKGTDKLKDKVGQPGEIKGVDPDNGTICENVEEECPEYRYVGKNVNNYVYFNCDSTKEQNSSNCELWRIVGIFTEGEEEHLKIVKDDVLTTDKFPATYQKGGTTYNIKNSSGNYAYWNYKRNETNNNDWATAGLQYWLNTKQDERTNTPKQGYLSYLNEGVENLIATTKYYLGTVTYKYTSSSNYGIKDTPKEAYANERAVNECASGVGPDSNSSTTAVESNKTCRVWKGNQATWTGKIGLLYPSDYGFSTDSKYWNTPMNFGSFNGEPSKTSWLQSANHDNYAWLLSPVSDGSYSASYWSASGFVSYVIVNHYYGVRPSLNLISDIGIKDGDGTKDNPYQLEYVE